MTDVESFKKVLRIFEIDKKKELDWYCRGITIDSEDFFYLILAAEQGLIGYNHRIHHKDIVPKELELDSGKIDPLETDESGHLIAESLKFFRKAKQIFEVRRFLVGHMFYTSNHKYWHFFYFDQRDHSKNANHWEHGPHIHLINWLWPNYNSKSLWSDFLSEKPKMKGALHIRYHDRNDGE